MGPNTCESKEVLDLSGPLRSQKTYETHMILGPPGAPSSQNTAGNIKFWSPQRPGGARTPVKTQDFVNTKGPRGARKSVTQGFGVPMPPRSQNICENTRFWSPQAPRGARTPVKTQGFGIPRAPEEPENL